MKKIFVEWVDVAWQMLLLIILFGIASALLGAVFGIVVRVFKWGYNLIPL